MVAIVPKGIPNGEWIKIPPNKPHAIRSTPTDHVYLRLGGQGGLYLAIAPLKADQRVLNSVSFETGEMQVVIPIPAARALRIGRGEDVAVKIKHAIISRVHTDILFDRTIVVVTDLGSTNGTFIHGKIPHFDIKEYLARRPAESASESTLDWVHEEFGASIDDFLKRYKED